MKSKKIEYQSVVINYPKRLYLVVSWLVTEDQKLLPYTHAPAYQNPKNGLREAKKIFKELNNKKQMVLENAMVVALDFFEKVPLKKEYWENPSFNYQNFDRATQFVKPYIHHSEYKILITPLSSKKQKFLAAIPFLKSANQNDIDSFMLSSDWPVDQKADAAAFYTMNKPIGIDIFTNEIIPNINQQSEDDDKGELTN